MKHYGVATKDCKFNLKCLPNCVPLIFTDYQMAKDACDEDEMVVEICFSVKEVDATEEVEEWN